MPSQGPASSCADTVKAWSAATLSPRPTGEWLLPPSRGRESCFDHKCLGLLGFCGEEVDNANVLKKPCHKGQPPIASRFGRQRCWMHERLRAAAAVGQFARAAVSKRLRHLRSRPECVAETAQRLLERRPPPGSRFPLAWRLCGCWPALVRGARLAPGRCRLGELVAEAVWSLDGVRRPERPLLQEQLVGLVAASIPDPHARQCLQPARV